jgi:hypothetical protein
MSVASVGDSVCAGLETACKQPMRKKNRTRIGKRDIVKKKEGDADKGTENVLFVENRIQKTAESS